MKNKITLIFLVVFLISFISAITIYSGESYSFQSEEFKYYLVVGNSSNLDGMNVTWEDGNITLKFSKYFAPDNFTLIFFNEKEKIIEVPVYGGGGTRTKYVDRNITGYVDVPKYIDREVEIEKEIEIEKEKETIIEKIPLWIVVLTLLLLIGVYELVKNTLRKRESNHNPIRDIYTDERRLKNNGNKKNF